MMGDLDKHLTAAYKRRDLPELDRLLRKHQQSTKNRISQGALDSTLRVACRAGREFFVQKLINAGADVDSRKLYGLSPLMMVAKRGKADMVRLLLSNGAYALQENHKRETAVHFALYLGHFECAKILLEKEKPKGKYLGQLAEYLAQRCCTEALKFLASHYNDQVSSQILLVPAVISGNTEIVQSLLDRGADLNIPCMYEGTALKAAINHLCEPLLMTMVIFLTKNGARVNGGTKVISPLVECVLSNKTNIINYLIDSGADVNEMGDGDCNTPLTAAISNLWNRESRVCSLVEILLLAGADPNKSNCKGQTALHFAVERGFSEIISKLIAAGAQLDSRNNDGDTALHLAVTGGNNEIVSKLIAAGAQLDSRNNDGDTALHLAVTGGNNEIVSKLIAAGAQLDSRNNNGDTALHLAVTGGNNEIVSKLIAAGTQMEARNNEGDTALHLAAARGNNEIVRKLAAAGAQMEALNNEGNTDDRENTALHLAVAGGKSKTVSKLIAAGAELDARDYRSNTALHLAIGKGNRSIISKLIAAGAQLETRNDEYNTALHMAVRRGYSIIVSKLIEAGAQLEARNDKQYTAIHLAAAGGKRSIVSKLIEAGAQLDTKNNEGNTALHLAIEGDNIQIVNSLIAAGAQLDTKNNEGNTALHLAIKGDNIQIVNSLIAAGAQFKAQNIKGNTPFHLAVREGNIEMVRKLIAAGAELEARNNEGNTALHLAAAGGYSEIVDKLIDAGAQFGARNIDGNSVLHLAVRGGNCKIVSKLIAVGAQLEMQNTEGNTSLHLAAEGDSIQIVNKLIAAGAQLGARNIKGNSSLPLASPGGNSKIVSKLIRAGTELEARNHEGNTALHLAAVAGNSEIIGKLISAGAVLEARNYDRLTPFLLTVALVKDTPSIMPLKLLKECGADLKAVDKDGNTFLHLMVQSGQVLKEEILRLLGYDRVINTQTKNGMTPLMLAAKELNYNAINVLLEVGVDPNIVNYASPKACTALSIVLKDRKEEVMSEYTASDCAELLMNNHTVTSLPRCYFHFHKIIIRDDGPLIQLMVTRGMPPLCEIVETVRDHTRNPHMDVYDKMYKFSPLAVALICNNTTIARYMVENCFLTPADVVGSSELQHLTSLLERSSQVESLRFIEENLSQPMSLFQLSFVAVSAQLGGMAGREERVRKTPLPQIIQDMLLFQDATSLWKGSDSPTQ
ncbi:serine/threonine-protein phosphatase 6 regulatory ankyrin repeat subunit a [Plakobranchus ocellatus]|uniref:Serine/threonine-protein phosphatase 6 regulatory ankyrin repeat subunit a n=1 Tax=Plakobranchus ocellatus TaxID=259542 RepID=A0AAV3YZV0_9GAST|nr:serine/threonine-protein phosphatase 6 regulatory ankyrin repeat subunit a [Plakobranchus ocellatus]